MIQIVQFQVDNRNRPTHHPEKRYRRCLLHPETSNSRKENEYEKNQFTSLRRLINAKHGLLF